MAGISWTHKLWSKPPSPDRSYCSGSHSHWIVLWMVLGRSQGSTTGTSDESWQWSMLTLCRSMSSPGMWRRSVCLYRLKTLMGFAVQWRPGVCPQIWRLKAPACLLMRSIWSILRLFSQYERAMPKPMRHSTLAAHQKKTWRGQGSHTTSYN